MSDHMAFNALVDNDPLSLRDVATDLAGFARWASAFFDGECRYDHNDDCQQHACDPRPCPVERIRVVLATIALVPADRSAVPSVAALALPDLRGQNRADRQAVTALLAPMGKTPGFPSWSMALCSSPNRRHTLYRRVERGSPPSSKFATPPGDAGTTSETRERPAQPETRPGSPDPV